jgi:hypothetical protein
LLARDLWKKKYFLEKKKTPQLEDKVQILLNKIENSQLKYFNTMEFEVRNAPVNGQQNQELLLKVQHISSRNRSKYFLQK